MQIFLAIPPRGFFLIPRYQSGGLQLHLCLRTFLADRCQIHRAVSVLTQSHWEKLLEVYKTHAEQEPLLRRVIVLTCCHLETLSQ